MEQSEAIKESAEAFFKLSTNTKRFNFLSERFCYINEAPKNKIELAINSAFVFSGVNYYQHELDDLIGLINHSPSDNHFILNRAEKENSLYTFACKEYKNLLSDIQKVDSEQEANMRACLGQSRYSKASAPPDCIIFYATQTIAPMSELKVFIPEELKP